MTPLTSVATERNSAPVVFGHKRAMRSNRISLSTLILLKGERKVRSSNFIQLLTFGRVCAEFELGLRCQVRRTPRGGPDVQDAVKRDPAYRVYNNISAPIRFPSLNPYLFVAINTLMFPLGSNPSN